MHDHLIRFVSDRYTYNDVRGVATSKANSGVSCDEKQAHINDIPVEWEVDVG